MSGRDRRAPQGGNLGPASRAFLQITGSEAALESEEPSRARKLAALGLAVLALLAVPVLWLTLGPGSDQASAVLAAKSHDDSSGPGSGDDDNSGPGSGDDDEDSGDDSASITASASSLGNRETAGTTRGEASTHDGTATSRRADTRGTTRGEPSTRVTDTGTSHGVDSTNGTTAGATTG
jgi:hypothetical protein